MNPQAKVFGTSRDKPDLALVQTRNEIKLGRFVATIQLPSDGQDFNHRKGCMVLGWGSLDASRDDRPADKPEVTDHR